MKKTSPLLEVSRDREASRSGPKRGQREVAIEVMDPDSVFQSICDIFSQNLPSQDDRMNFSETSKFPEGYERFGPGEQWWGRRWYTCADCRLGAYFHTDSVSNLHRERMTRLPAGTAQQPFVTFVNISSLGSDEIGANTGEHKNVFELRQSSKRSSEAHARTSSRPGKLLLSPSECDMYRPF